MHPEGTPLTDGEGSTSPPHTAECMMGVLHESDYSRDSARSTIQ